MTSYPSAISVVRTARNPQASAHHETCKLMTRSRRDGSSARTPILSPPTHPRPRRRSLRRFVCPQCTCTCTRRHAAVEVGKPRSSHAAALQDPQPRGKDSPPPIVPEHCVPLAAGCPLMMPCSRRQVNGLAVSTRQSFLLLAHQSVEHTRGKQVRQSHLQLPLDAGKRLELHLTRTGPAAILGLATS